MIHRLRINLWTIDLQLLLKYGRSHFHRKTALNPILCTTWSSFFNQLVTTVHSPWPFVSITTSRFEQEIEVTDLFDLLFSMVDGQLSKVFWSTKYVDDIFWMLVKALAVFVNNILYILAKITNIQMMSPLSKFYHQHPKIITNIQSRTYSHQPLCHKRLVTDLLKLNSLRLIQTNIIIKETPIS